VTSGPLPEGNHLATGLLIAPRLAAYALLLALPVRQPALSPDARAVWQRICSGVECSHLWVQGWPAV